MISCINDYIKIDTAHTSLLFRVRKEYTEVLYYGERLPDADNYDVFGKSLCIAKVGCEDYVTARLPCSFTGTGNGTESFLIVKNADGSYVNRFEYTGCDVVSGEEENDAFPHARGKRQTLVLHYADACAKLALDLFYSVFEGSDAIVAKSRVTYNGEGSVELLRCMSLQFDLWGNDYEAVTFDGIWARERNLNRRPVNAGVFVNDSKLGASSNRHNPFFMLTHSVRREVYAFNLVYSGNHKEIAEATEDGRTHVLTGLNDYLFSWRLSGGESFQTPEAVMLFAPSEDDATARMHAFVRGHILPPDYKNALRPVLLNNWEATYFDFNSEKLCALLERAKQAGIELFVLDDGWFGRRNDDSTSLGDWTIENPKIEGGLARFSARVKEAGLKFGLWLEPEMISENSELFRAHPEYVMRNHRPPIARRNQLMLDLTRGAVQQYLIDTVSAVIEKYSLDYIKWDYNRNMSDMYGGELREQGEYFHRYICGLYNVLSALRAKYPHVLFEACASGGNRYDLGILYYMPQIWASDNTDAYDRIFIQEGTLYAYPQNTMGAHVSVCPNHQTGNSVLLEDRFQVAAFGVLGYELDLTLLSEAEMSAIAQQVSFYKEHRALLQNGRYCRLDSAFCGNGAGAIVLSEDGSEALAFVCVKRKITGIDRYRFYLKGLDPQAEYEVVVRRRADCDENVSFTASGAALMCGGADVGALFEERGRENNSAALASRVLWLKKKG